MRQFALLFEMGEDDLVLLQLHDLIIEARLSSN